MGRRLHGEELHPVPGQRPVGLRHLRQAHLRRRPRRGGLTQRNGRWGQRPYGGRPLRLALLGTSPERRGKATALDRSPLASPVRGGGICAANDGEVVTPVPCCLFPVPSGRAAERRSAARRLNVNFIARNFPKVIDNRGPGRYNR